MDVGILAIYNVGGSFITLSIHFLPNIVFCAGQKGIRRKIEKENRKKWYEQITNRKKIKIGNTKNSKEKKEILR